MIIEIPNENSIVKWKNDDKDEWKVAEISDLIKAYERPRGDLISREALKKALEITQYNDIDDLTRTERLIDNAPTVHHPNCDNCEDKAKQYTLGFQDGYDYGYNFKYSDCDKQVVDKTNFCQNCGVAMQNEGIKNETRPNECQCGKIKLLIDVDEELVCKGFEHPFTEEERNILIRAIGNGILYEERPKGRWIHRQIIAKDRSFDMVVCSNCQTEFSWDAETGVSMDNYKTCPNCDADMRSEKNENL